MENFKHTQKQSEEHGEHRVPIPSFDDCHMGSGLFLITSPRVFCLSSFVVLVSGVQQSDSVAHIHTSILFSDSFPIEINTDY